MLRREYFSLYLDVLMCFDVANINFFCVESMYSLCCNGTSDDKVHSVPIGRPALASQLL